MLALAAALVFDVTWKWKFIVAGIIAATFFLPSFLPATEAMIVAIVVRTLLAITFVVRRQLPDGLLE